MFSEATYAYTCLLDTLRNKSSAQLIRNDSLSHAILLVCDMIEHAKDEILIYSSSFSKAFYLREEIVKAFKTSAERGVPVKLLIQYEFDKSEDTMEQKETIAIYKYNIYRDAPFEHRIFAPSESITLNNKQLNNFLVVDGMSFRYEKLKLSKDNYINGSIISKVAVGSLNDSGTAKSLTESFYEVF